MAASPYGAKAFCGGCGHPIAQMGIGWEAVGVKFGDKLNGIVGIYRHYDYWGMGTLHFPGNYWKGIEQVRDEYLESLGIEFEADDIS